MTPKNIGFKEVYRNLPKIALAANHGQSFVVYKYSKPMFNITPNTQTKPKKYKLEDLFGIRFKFKKVDPNLSKKVDEIVYGNRV